MINDAASLKLYWDFFISFNQWAQLLRHKIMRKTSPINYHISSSILSRIKSNFHAVIDNSRWNLGDDKTINFWSNTWCGEPLVDQLNHPMPPQANLLSKFGNFIHNFSWRAPTELLSMYPTLKEILEQVHLPLSPRPDELKWIHLVVGNLNFKDAYLFKVTADKKIN